jgi:hypothetical protein
MFTTVKKVLYLPDQEKVAKLADQGIIKLHAAQHSSAR